MSKLGWIAWNREVTRLTRIGMKPTLLQRIRAYRNYRRPDFTA